MQQTDPTIFTERLRGVWAECHRVLRPDGLLVFTYHHSRAEGWRSVLEALVSAGFAITAAHPIKAEMSVAMPKQQAKEPIDLDVILVCRKRESVRENVPQFKSVLPDAVRTATYQIARLNNACRKLSRNDVRVVLTAQVIAHLSRVHDRFGATRSLEKLEAAIDGEIKTLYNAQALGKRSSSEAKVQMALFAN